MIIQVIQNKNKNTQTDIQIIQIDQLTMYTKETGSPNSKLAVTSLHNHESIERVNGMDYYFSLFQHHPYHDQSWTM